MRMQLVALSCLATLLLPLRVAVAAPPTEKAPGALPPPKAAVTPTPRNLLVRKPFPLAPCSVTATLTLGPLYKANPTLVVEYAGPMTFTANRDLNAVTLYTMNYDDKPGGQFLGGCACPQFPKGGDDPATAPPSTNFKRLESRTYQISCAWPAGGLPPTGLYRFEVYIAHFVKNSAGAWQKKIDSCGAVTPAN